MRKKQLKRSSRRVVRRPAAPRRKARPARVPTAELWVNMMLIRAARDRASDIHIKPTGSGVTVLFRIDGGLRRVKGPPDGLDAAVIERLKVMSRMNPAEERIAQDGRFGAIIDGREIDFRVSSFPMAYGETIVMKLLDRARLMPLDKLGFSPSDLKRVRELISRPSGLVLVAGSHGSGKTTLLYALLSEFDSAKRNIVTIEYPIEFDLKGVGQSQVNPAAGFTYPAALAKVLRQDPDIIMVGGLGDSETARATMQAALASRLVFSSIHAGDAADALVRLLGMSAEPVNVANGLAGIIVGRLVRRICPSCKHGYPLPSGYPEDMQKMGAKTGRRFYEGRGCGKCGHTGYRGQTAVFEIVPMTDALRKLVLTNPDAAAVRTAIRKGGVPSKHEDGIAKAAAGITSLEEAMSG